MKKFIFKSLLFFIGSISIYLLGILFIAPLGYSKSTQGRVSWAKSLKPSNHTTRFIIGNSVAAGLKPSLAAKNLHIEATGPIVGYYLIDEILKNKTHTETIFLAYAPTYINQVTERSLKRLITSFSNEQVETALKLKDSLGDNNFFAYEDIPSNTLQFLHIPYKLIYSPVIINDRAEGIKRKIRKCAIAVNNTLFGKQEHRKRSVGTLEKKRGHAGKEAWARSKRNVGTLEKKRGHARKETWARSKRSVGTLEKKRGHVGKKAWARWKKSVGTLEKKRGHAGKKA